MNIDGLALQLARHADGLTRDEMAEKIGVSGRTIANWEKNGIPQHRESLVLSKLGQGFNSAIAEAGKMRYLETPEGARQESEWLERQAELLGYNEQPQAKSLSVEDVLRPFSTKALLAEVERRAEKLQSLVHKLSSAIDESLPVDSDGLPDYSNMSDEDVRQNRYDLAAKEADKNIGFDDLPNEP